MATATAEELASLASAARSHQVSTGPFPPAEAGFIVGLSMSLSAAGFFCFYPSEGTRVNDYSCWLFREGLPAQHVLMRAQVFAAGPLFWFCLSRGNAPAPRHHIFGGIHGPTEIDRLKPTQGLGQSAPQCSDQSSFSKSLYASASRPSWKLHRPIQELHCCASFSSNHL